MNQTTPSHPHRDTPAWQNIGEMRLPVRPKDGDVTLALLAEKLDPLQLPAELLLRIAKSIQEILQRAVTKEPGLELAQLIIFIPTSYDAKRGSWGFFRIERAESGGDGIPHSHGVDLYLYPDGK